MVLGMWQKFQRFLDRAESRLALYVALGGSSAMGVIGGWLSTYSEWISQFGPIGWFFSSLLAALVAAFLSVGVAWVRFLWIRASAVRNWRADTDAINPLDEEFVAKRINLTDLADPISRTIEGKTFSRCDLLGPINLLLDGGSFNSVAFINCDIVPLKPSAKLQNVTRLADCTVTRGRIAGATIYIHPDAIEHFKAMGVRDFPTYLKDEVQTGL